MTEEKRGSSIFGNKQWFRCKDLSEILSMGQSTIYKMVRNGTFPKPVAITPKLSVWRRDLILCWMQDKTEGIDTSNHQETIKVILEN